MASIAYGFMNIEYIIHAFSEIDFESDEESFNSVANKLAAQPHYDGYTVGQIKKKLLKMIEDSPDYQISFYQMDWGGEFVCIDRTSDQASDFFCFKK